MSTTGIQTNLSIFAQKIKIKPTNYTMALQTINPTQTAAWAKLQQHYNAIASTSMQELFQADASRVEKFNLKWNDFLLDYSKNRINQETINLLLDLANQVGLKEAIASYFEGELINQTENRAVLHTALRANESSNIKVDRKNVIPEVFEVKSKIKNFTNEVVNGDRKGFTGKPFTDIVNIHMLIHLNILRQIII